MTPADTSDRTQERIVSRSLGGTIAAICMAAFMLIGLLINIVALSEDSATDTPPYSLADMLDGTTSKQIADELAQTVLPKEAAKLQRAANWLALGDLGPKVRRGCNNWLFLTDELTTHADGEKASQLRATQVEAVQKMLARQDIRLIVAVVPDKSRIMQDQLCGLQRPAILENRVQSWIQQLHDRGIAAVDLSQPMQASESPSFLRTDTHWNATGAQLAAQAIAAKLKEHYGAPLLPRQTVEVQTGQPHIRHGDLVRLAGVDWLPTALQPKSEEVAQLTFNVKQDPVADSADDLFGDDNLPTAALIGSSFSRTSHFDNFLSLALQTPIANMSKDGGAFSGSAHDYFRSPAYKQTPPKIVIWEIPERDLQAPLDKDVAILPP